MIFQIHHREQTGRFVALVLMLCFCGWVNGKSAQIDQQLNAFVSKHGGTVNLYAAEPLVKNPIHMNWDIQGRLWVLCSSLSQKPAEDQVVVLEDTTNDGKADSATLFADQLNAPSAILPSHDGAYLASATGILFLKDTNNDGKADQQKTVVSGNGKRLHNMRWTPFGTIAFQQGGTLLHLNPSNQKIYTISEGLIDSWGHSIDQFGQSYMTSIRGGQGLYYILPHSSQIKSDTGQSNYSGLEILSAQQIPESVQGMFAAADFTNGTIELYKTTGLETNRSTSLISNNTPDYQPADLKIGPDGALYIADWHSSNKLDKSTNSENQLGRIWRVAFSDQPHDKFIDFSSKSEQQLSELFHPVGWQGTMAMVELQSRNPDSALQGIQQAWTNLTKQQQTEKLHLLMASQAVNQLQSEWATDLVAETDDSAIRAGVMRCLYFSPSSANTEISKIGVSDDSLEVRLWAVSLLTENKDPDTVYTALESLENLPDSPKNHILETMVQGICRSNSASWLPKTKNGNPFSNTRQLTFALTAIGKNAEKEGHDKEDKQKLRKIATDQKISIEKRVTAIEELIEIDNTDGSKLAAVVLPIVNKPIDSRPIFKLFLKDYDSTVSLANALKSIELPRAIAIEGIDQATASGLNPEELIKVLNGSLLHKKNTTSQTFIREWQVLQSSEQLRKAIEESGIEAFVAPNNSYLWTKIPSDKNGRLPLSKQALLDQYQVIRVKLATTETTDIRIKLENNHKGISLFVDQTQPIIPETIENEMDFTIGLLIESGEHYLTLVIKDQPQEMEPPRLQIIEPGKVKFSEK